MEGEQPLNPLQSYVAYLWSNVTPTYQLAIKVSRSMLLYGKLPKCHPYITTSYASYYGVSFSVALRKRLHHFLKLKLMLYVGTTIHLVMYM